MAIQVQSLIPSELVFFNGEKFASSKGIFNKVSLLHTDVQVNKVELVQHLLAAAFLANERAGWMRLELRQKKVLFGLGSKTALFADPTGKPAEWEGACLEDDLLNAARRASNSEVDTLVSVWLGQDVSDPYQEVIGRVKAHLAERGLLDMQEERKLKIFVSRSYSLNSEAQSFIAAQPLQPLTALLQNCQTTRPEVWQELLKQIKKGVDSRQEKMDTDS